MWGGDAGENDARFEETLEVVLKGLQGESPRTVGSSTTSRICGWSCARFSSRYRPSGTPETPHTRASGA